MELCSQCHYTFSSEGRIPYAVFVVLMLLYSWSVPRTIKAPLFICSANANTSADASCFADHRQPVRSVAGPTTMAPTGDSKLHNDGVASGCASATLSFQAAVHVSALITKPNIAKDMPSSDPHYVYSVQAIETPAPFPFIAFQVLHVNEY
ncbi:hypothetical protein EI94DRAFT_1731292 [Lactarius quietus]|nr:hypothetical protein EI94DRAFT_1731292 [Lactarius quietus]